MRARCELSVTKGGSVLLVAGLSNANSPVTDTPAARTVIVCRRMNVLGKGLHGVLHAVLHDARPPDVAGWCQRFLHRRAAVSLIHYAPKS